MIKERPEQGRSAIGRPSKSMHSGVKMSSLEISCGIVAMFAVAGVSNSLAQTSAPAAEKIMYVVEGEGPRIADSLLPTDRLLIVRKTISHPPYRLEMPTMAEEVARLQAIADAIVMLEVQRVESRVNSTGDWIKTAVHGTVKDVLRAAKYPLGDGKAIDFQFDGGEVRFGETVVKTDRYPILQTGSTYLVFFSHDSSGQYWYPFMPLLLDKDGNFIRTEMFDWHNLPFESPLYGRPAKEIIERFRRPIGVF